ncbi:MAG: oligosaccharide flippase family protein [Anaerolineae bacterium]|nr:oligosaccharide flippase family protein [Anaerolineae bacterium]
MSLMQRSTARVQKLFKSKFVRDTLVLQAGKLVLFVVSVATFVIVFRELGAEQYGIYQLAINLHGIILTFNILGYGQSTITQMAEAVGAQDRDEVRNLMGFFMQMALLVGVLSFGVSLFAPAFSQAANDNSYIGELTRLYAVMIFMRPIFNLTLIALQSIRAMAAYSYLENAANLIESGLKIGAALLGWGALGIIVAYVVAYAIKAVLSLAVYVYYQRRRPEILPPVSDVLGKIGRVSVRPYMGFGVSVALDKNLAGLYTSLPLQFVGMWAGEAAAGFLSLAIKALSYPALFFTGVLTNLEVRFPADVGAGDFVRLQDNMRRVLRWTVPIAVLGYGAFAIFAPLLVPILDEEAIPAIDVVRVLCLYGAITGIGGIFGPLYRTLRLVRVNMVIKIVSLLAAALPAFWLIQHAGAIGGAWTVNLIYGLSVALTVIVVWSRLRGLAAAQAI